MCEANGKLSISVQLPNGYMKGRVGHKGFYIPSKGGSRIAQQARAANGSIVNAELVRGMLVRIRR